MAGGTSHTFSPICLHRTITAVLDRCQCPRRRLPRRLRPVGRETQIYRLGRWHLGQGRDHRGRWSRRKAGARIEAGRQTAHSRPAQKSKARHDARIDSPRLPPHVHPRPLSPIPLILFPNRAELWLRRDISSAFSFVPREGYRRRPAPIPGVDGVPRGNKKARHSPGFSSSLLGRAAAYAASSSTTVSSSSASPSPSAGFGPRRGPLARAASISLIASVSVMRCTAEISRESRSSAAS